MTSIHFDFAGQPFPKSKRLRLWECGSSMRRGCPDVAYGRENIPHHLGLSAMWMVSLIQSLRDVILFTPISVSEWKWHYFFCPFPNSDLHHFYKLMSFYTSISMWTRVRLCILLTDNEWKTLEKSASFHDDADIVPMFCPPKLIWPPLAGLLLFDAISNVPAYPIHHARMLSSSPHPLEYATLFFFISFSSFSCSHSHHINLILAIQVCLQTANRPPIYYLTSIASPSITFILAVILMHKFCLPAPFILSPLLPTEWLAWNSLLQASWPCFW